MQEEKTQVLFQGFFAAEGSIALLTVERRGVRRRIPQVLLQGLLAAEESIAGCATVFMRRRISFVLHQSLVAVKRPIARNTTAAHIGKEFVPVLICAARKALIQSTIHLEAVT